MFTGIVQAIGVVEVVEWRKTGLRLAIKLPVKLKRIALGSSVAINGVCLTVAKERASVLDFDVVSETVRRTTLGSLKRGERVNVELSLKMGDEIGGHFVLGHVDGVGVVKALRQEGIEALLTIGVPKRLMRYIVEKGSVAVDGVSLTVAAVRGSTFIVALVPYTIKATTLGMLKRGDRVNIETDVVAKYLNHCKGINFSRS